MASTVHLPAYPQPPFVSHEHSSSMNGSFPPPQLQSFDTSQSVASNPSETPPQPRTFSQQMSFGMGVPPPMNGVPQRNTFGPYSDMNGYNPQAYYGVGPKPQIYTAVYSSVHVYEMEINGIAVMRRRSDSWLNATQILKVAGVDKGKRTKVLEKEILSGKHEKVQGGYGKYQGTWVDYKRGVEFCRQYGVEELLRPLLEYDLGQDGVVNTQGGIETPTKEQALAAQRKRLYQPMDNRPPTQGQNGTFFKSMSSTAANAVSALNRARYESPGRGMDGRRSIGARRASQQPFPPSQDSMYPSGSQQSMASQDSFSGSMQNGGSFNYGESFADFPNTDGQSGPRKRMRLTPQDSFTNNVDPGLELSLRDGSPTEPSGSFMSQNNQSFMAGAKAGPWGLEPLPAPRGPIEDRKRELLLDLFIDPSQTDFTDHPAFLTLSGDEFEVPIDGSCNTALHWAATLARVSLVRHLLAKGFNMNRTNSGGETALIAACQARNNLDQNSFPDLIDLLGPSVEIRDGRGRTLLHHIAVSSAMKGRAGVGKYYLESLLAYVVKQGSNPSSQELSQHDSGYGSRLRRSSMNLTRFMADIVNVQDKSGDTALNLAARTSTRSIIDQLIEVGADPHISNNGGLSPTDFGVESPSQQFPLDQSLMRLENPPNGTGSSQASFIEAQSDIMTSIQDILSASENDFTAELREKDEVLDNTNRALKELSTALSEDRRRLEELQAKAREKDELGQKIANLHRSAAELRNGMSQANGQTITGGDGVMTNVSVGEADKGLDFDGRLADVERLFPAGDPGPHLSLTQEQTALLSSGERMEVLRGRVNAYQQHNQSLENQVKDLASKGAELEERYRKIVSLCTNVDIDRVDEVLDGLLAAVVSEQKDGAEFPMQRAREFLRLVQGEAD